MENKIYISLGICLLLSLSLVSAFDEELTQVCGGSDELIIHCLGDAELNSLGFEVEAEEGEEPAGGRVNILGDGEINYFYYFIFFVLLLILICLFIILIKRRKNED